MKFFTVFVKDIIGVPLEIDRVETEKEFAPPVGYVKPKFDLFAEDYRHRIVVDIQNSRPLRPFFILSLRRAYRINRQN